MKGSITEKEFSKKLKLGIDIGCSFCYNPFCQERRQTDFFIGKWLISQSAQNESVTPIQKSVGAPTQFAPIAQLDRVTDYE